MKEHPLNSFEGQEGVWVNEFQCCVHLVQYNPLLKFGSVMMLTGNCCDMGGAIRYFERIDPEVTSILSYYPSGQNDTSYHKRNGEWRAMRAKEPRPIREFPHSVDTDFGVL